MTSADTTYQIRLSGRFTQEHTETSSMPGTFINANGHGMLMEFTLGELHELWSRADNYADPYYARDLAESGLSDLHRSAVKVLDQLRRADLLTLAKSQQARDASNTQSDALRAN